MWRKVKLQNLDVNWRISKYFLIFYVPSSSSSLHSAFSLTRTSVSTWVIKNSLDISGSLTCFINCKIKELVNVYPYIFMLLIFITHNSILIFQFVTDLFSFLQFSVLGFQFHGGFFVSISKYKYQRKKFPSLLQ